MGLRVRLILILVIPLVLVVGAYGLFRVRDEQAQVWAQYRLNVALTTKAVQIAVENALRDRQISDIKRLLSEIVEDQAQIDRIRLFDRALHPTLVSNPLSTTEDVPRDAMRRVIETGQPEAFYDRRGKQPIFFYLVPIRGSKGQIQGAMEVAHLSQEVERRREAAVRDVWLRLGVLLLAVAVLAGLMLQRQVLRPLARLMEGIQSLGQGEPGSPVPIERRDELGRVAEAFNQMAERLEAARLKLAAETERALDLEQQLRQAETLAVAGKLTTGLAHEVGTPLNIISGRAEFLLQTLPVDDARRKDLEVIVGQIDRISGIIRSLLDVVRPRKPEVRATALVSVFEPLRPLLQHTARRRGVVLRSSIPEGVPSVAADPHQLQQVLINLVINALEATPAGGRVSVSVRATTQDGRPGVAVSVADTGQGIPPALLPRVFEPFFTTKPPGQGTGLGLAISRDIVRAHGGEIRVESRAGEGTTFVVWLPESEGTQS